jgi:hypothetical protein
MRESIETSDATVEVRGITPRAFRPGVSPAERLRKALETRLRNLTGKKAAQGFLNRAEEKMFRLLTRTVRAKTTDRAGVTISVQFRPPPHEEGSDGQKSKPTLV